MVDTFLLRPGSNENGADKRELFLKMFAGEVITAFDEKNVMMGLHQVRAVGSGKSHQIPRVGTATAAYHVPGEDIIDNANGMLSDIRQTEITVNIDELLTSNFMYPMIDDLLTHYDARSEYARQTGLALANKFDKQMLQLAVLAARSSETLTDPNKSVTLDGHVLTQANFGGGSISGATLIDGLFDAAQEMDSKDVPSEGRVFICPPAQYYALIQTAGSPSSLVNADYTRANQGAMDKGVVFECAGFQIVMSNHVPQANIAAETGANNTYHGDFSTTVGVAINREAIVTVRRKGVSVETGWKQERQSWLTTATMLHGSTIKRPECAVEFKTA